MTPEEERRVERTMHRLTKPTYVYRMARAKLHSRDPRGKGADKSYAKAVAEIDAILREEYGNGSNDPA